MYKVAIDGQLDMHRELSGFRSLQEKPAQNRGMVKKTHRLGSCERVAIELIFFFFQAEDGIRDLTVTGVQMCSSDLGSLERRPGRKIGAPVARPTAPTDPRVKDTQ